MYVEKICVSGDENYTNKKTVNDVPFTHVIQYIYKFFRPDSQRNKFIVKNKSILYKTLKLYVHYFVRYILDLVEE